MTIGYIRPINPPGPMALVEFITIGPGSPPDRPHPGPPNWSPVHPSHPIANPSPPYVDIGGPGPQPPFGPGGPVDPGYSPPWAQVPVDPGYSPPWARPGAGPGVPVTIYPLPESVPQPPVPPGIPTDSKLMLIGGVPGTQGPIPVWVPPYASTGPVA